MTVVVGPFFVGKYLIGGCSTSPHHEKEAKQDPVTPEVLTPGDEK